MAIRFACISDTHLTSRDYRSNSLFPLYLKRLSQAQQEMTYGRFRRVIFHSHEEALREIARERPLNALLHFGDLTGGWNEQGLEHESVIPIAERALKCYRSYTSRVHVCWGNHDTGYGRRIGCISLASVRRCQQLSPLWWSWDTGDMVFIGVCSPLMSEKPHDEERRALQDLRSEQNEFVADTLRSIKGRPWVLCTHDPDVSELSWITAPYAKSLLRMIYGDKHNLLVGGLERLRGYLPFGGFANLARRRGVCCPSVAPLWWSGRAYLSATLHGNDIGFALKRFGSPRLRQSARAVPISSFIKTVRWVVRDKVRSLLVPE